MNKIIVILSQNYLTISTTESSASTRVSKRDQNPEGKYDIRTSLWRTCSNSVLWLISYSLYFALLAAPPCLSFRSMLDRV